MKDADAWTFPALLRALGPLVREVDGRTGCQFSDIVTDSRAAFRAAVFVALRGERFDGHDFAAAAIERGAAALVVERRLELPQPCPQIIVSDTGEAYGALARAWRGQFNIPLIAVVGANGKTTTTQMIAAILRAALGEEKVLATRENFNNAVGVPRTLLGLHAGVRAAVVEAGISRPGEMARLAGWIRPTVVVITNAQREHQEFLSDVTGSARENGMALVALTGRGTAVLPADDPALLVWLDFARARGCQVSRYGLTGAADAQVSARSEDGALILRLGADSERRVDFAPRGAHAAHDAAAAAAAALAIGINEAAITAGLSSFEPLPGRGRHYRLPSGAVLIDESYNANPDSVRAAIDALSGMPGPRLLALGDMAETGPANFLPFHREIGGYARDRGVDRLLACGAGAAEAARVFGCGGRAYADLGALTADLRQACRGPLTLLVKASRAAGFERLVNELTAAPEEPAEAPGAAADNLTGTD